MDRLIIYVDFYSGFSKEMLYVIKWLFLVLPNSYACLCGDTENVFCFLNRNKAYSCLSLLVIDRRKFYCNQNYEQYQMSLNLTISWGAMKATLVLLNTKAQWGISILHLLANSFWVSYLIDCNRDIGLKIFYSSAKFISVLMLSMSTCASYSHSNARSLVPRRHYSTLLFYSSFVLSNKQIWFNYVINSKQSSSERSYASSCCSLSGIDMNQDCSLLTVQWRPVKWKFLFDVMHEIKQLFKRH